MKKIVCLWVVGLFLVGLAIGQRKGKPSMRKPAPVSTFAEAEKAWVPFWNKFREAVKIKSKQDLYDLMADDFDYNSGDFEKGRDSDIRKFVCDKGSCGGWDDLNRIIPHAKISLLLRKGELIGGLGSVKYSPTRVVSALGNIKKREICEENSEWALFEFRRNKWLFVELSSCEVE